MLSILKRELRSYCNSMIAYIYMAIFLIVIGIYFVVYNLVYAVASFQLVLNGVQFLFVIIVPILTMRLLAEERKQKTDQLLLTSPLTITKIVLGKYFAALALFVMSMLVICFYPLILTQYGDIDLSIAYSCIFGFTMLGAAYLAIGLYISSITENQVIALIITAVVILISNIMPSIISMLPSDHETALLICTILLLMVCVIAYVGMHNLTISIALAILSETALVILYFVKPSFYDGIVSNVLGVFSLGERYTNFAIGILDVNCLVYYFSIICLFVLLTIQTIKKRRWN